MSLKVTQTQMKIDGSNYCWHHRKLLDLNLLSSFWNADIADLHSSVEEWSPMSTCHQPSLLREKRWSWTYFEEKLFDIANQRKTKRKIQLKLFINQFLLGRCKGRLSRVLLNWFEILLLSPQCLNQSVYREIQWIVFHLPRFSFCLTAPLIQHEDLIRIGKIENCLKTREMLRLHKKFYGLLENRASISIYTINFLIENLNRISV